MLLVRISPLLRIRAVRSPKTVVCFKHDNDKTSKSLAWAIGLVCLSVVVLGRGWTVQVTWQTPVNSQSSSSIVVQTRHLASCLSLFVFVIP